MIKIHIANMACGHCRLKVKAELEAKEYVVHKIDMDDGSVLIDAELGDLNNIERILEHINYVLDNDMPPVVIEEYLFWDDKLDDTDNYHSLSDFLREIDVPLVGFDEERFRLIVQCTQDQRKTISDYLERM